MAASRRVLWEFVLFALLALAVIGVWQWWQSRLDQTVSRISEEGEARLAAVRAEMSGKIDSLASGQAEAVFRAFAAGVQPAVLGGRQDSIDLAVGQLLELPGVAFVHVLKPDGTVIASSNRKFAALGNAGERSRWALSVGELTERPGELSGTTELAAPIQGASGPVAYLWIAYETPEPAISSSAPQPAPAPSPEGSAGTS